MTFSTKTLAAITTPLGEGGIGVVQISGPKALDIVNGVFRSKRIDHLREAKTNRLYYGHIEDERGVVDEVIVCVFRGKSSPTGADAVEINCHGGIKAITRTLDLVVRRGAEKARWPDLAEQSVESGRIDAIQREALLEIPNAHTKLAAKVLVEQYNGCLSAKLKEIYARLKEIAQSATERKDLVNIGETTEAMRGLLSTADFGIGLCSPRRIAVIGKPNVGKSTLVNALLAHDRVIVHSQPGTTRDSVAELIEIGGVPYVLVDTAGLRQTQDHIESLSIEETNRRIAEADIILAVFDNTRRFDDEDAAILHGLSSLIHSRRAQPLVIPIINKTDGRAVLNPQDISASLGAPICRVSALKKEGLTDVENRINDSVVPLKLSEGCPPETPIIFTSRQRELIDGALSELNALEHGAADEAAVRTGESMQIVHRRLTEAMTKVAQCLGQDPAR